MVKNINTTTIDPFSSSFPKKGLVWNGSYFFQAEDYNGKEIWKTDGTGAGTVLTKDLASIFDRQDANPLFMNVINNNFYFFAQNQINLYEVNGTTGVMRNILSIGNPSPYEAVVCGNSYFYTDSSLDGWELAQFNVSNFGYSTYDINSGPAGSYPHHLTVKGDSVFFAASDAISGTELWMFDVPLNNLYQVQDINPGVDSSNPQDLVVYNDKLFFSADDGTDGNELWVSDGDATGTYLYEDINSGSGSSNPAHKTVFNGQLLYSATDGSNGVELWYTDDAFTLTGILADISVGSSSSNPGKFGFHAAGSLLYFAADDGSYDNELWATDGTGLGTYMVWDINSFGSSDPMDMHHLSDTLVFTANDGSGTPQLWASDGTNAYQVQPATTFVDTPHISGVYNGRVYFGGNVNPIGEELWKTDGTDANTVLVKDINLGSAISSDPQWFEPYNGFMYFGARDNPNYQFGLYRTDGTTVGTTQVYPGGGAQSFYVSYEHGKTMGSFLYFQAYTDTSGVELWKTDGTNIYQVKNINPGYGFSGARSFVTNGTTLFFIATNGTNGEELWKSNGTDAGTVMVKDINPGSGNSDIREMKILNNNLVFVANDGTTGEELWYSDGTTGGTILLKNFNGIAAGSDVSNLLVSGDTVYFRANDNISGLEMWISKGTPASTVLFKDINPGAGSSNPEKFERLGGYIYFGAVSSNFGYSKVWRTDGTSAGTSQFFDVNFPFFFTNIGSRIVFFTLPDTSTNGFHLWSTDGTVAGTGEIESFHPGTMGYLLLDEFPAYNGHWFMWLDNFIDGQELWYTNGTAAGTGHHDIAPGPHSSYPRSARGLNPLIFSAEDNTINGRELWQLNVPVPLPITGLEFEARRMDQTALLEWKTYAERNNLGFRVERSKDGKDFDSLGFVAAAPQALQGAQYHFTDLHPVQGRNFYRLRQMDVNGNFANSAVRMVDFNPAAFMQSYPNPTSDFLNINTGYTFQNARVSIHSMSGQLVSAQTASGNGTIRIDVKNLAAGVYTAEIAEGSTSLKLIFVKQ